MNAVFTTCLQFTVTTVVEEERQEVGNLRSVQNNSTHLWDNTAHVMIGALHKKCTALKWSHGRISGPGRQRGPET